MHKDLFVKEYLERLKLPINPLPDLNTLRMLQKRHLACIPFENLDIISNRRIELDVKQLWVKLIKQKRGGICYELNGLLFYLLKYIGFEVKYLAAQVLENGNEFDHVFLFVCIKEEHWLVDVGFGDHFIEPVKFVVDTVQKDPNGYFKILEARKGSYQLLKSSNGSEYSIEYTFTLQERKLEDFSERCIYFETSPDSRFRKNRLCSLETENGRISLKDDKLIITENGIRTEKSMEDDNEFKRNLREIYDIDLQNPNKFRTENGAYT